MAAVTAAAADRLRSRLRQDEVQLPEELKEIGGEFAGNLAGGLFVVGTVRNLLRQGCAEVQYFLILAHKA